MPNRDALLNELEHVRTLARTASLQAAASLPSVAPTTAKEKLGEALHYLGVAEVLETVLEIHGENGQNVSETLVRSAARLTTVEADKSLVRLYSDVAKRLIALGWAKPSDALR